MKTLFPLVLLTAMGPLLQAQSLQLPQDPRAWVNSPAVSMETLKGKGVVFYFFEEG